MRVYINAMDLPGEFHLGAVDGSSRGRPFPDIRPTYPPTPDATNADGDAYTAKETCAAWGYTNVYMRPPAANPDHNLPAQPTDTATERAQDPPCQTPDFLGASATDTSNEVEITKGIPTQDDRLATEQVQGTVASGDRTLTVNDRADDRTQVPDEPENHDRLDELMPEEMPPIDGGDDGGDEPPEPPENTDGLPDRDPRFGIERFRGEEPTGREEERQIVELFEDRVMRVRALRAAFEVRGREYDDRELQLENSEQPGGTVFMTLGTVDGGLAYRANFVDDQGNIASHQYDVTYVDGREVLGRYDFGPSPNDLPGPGDVPQRLLNAINTDRMRTELPNMTLAVEHGAWNPVGLREANYVLSLLTEEAGATPLRIAFTDLHTIAKHRARSPFAPEATDSRETASHFTSDASWFLAYRQTREPVVVNSGSGGATLATRVGLKPTDSMAEHYPVDPDKAAVEMQLRLLVDRNTMSVINKPSESSNPAQIDIELGYGVHLDGSFVSTHHRRVLDLRPNIRSNERVLEDTNRYYLTEDGSVRWRLWNYLVAGPDLRISHGNNLSAFDLDRRYAAPPR